MYYLYLARIPDTPIRYTLYAESRTKAIVMVSDKILSEHGEQMHVGIDYHVRISRYYPQREPGKRLGRRFWFVLRKELKHD